MYKKLPIILFSTFISLASCITSQGNVDNLLYATRSCSSIDDYYYVTKFNQSKSRNTYQEARQFSYDLAAIKQDNKWGFISSEEKIVIPLQFDYAGSFGEYGFDKNLALVKWGVPKDRNPIFSPAQTALINKKGQVVTPVYGYLFPIEYSIAIVNNGTLFHSEGQLLLSDGKWGAITKKGKLVIPCEYEVMYPFRDKITFVRKNGKWGCINDKGKLVIPCIYDNAFFKNDKVKMDTEFDLKNDNRENVSDSIFRSNIIYMFKDKKICHRTLW